MMKMKKLKPDIVIDGVKLSHKQLSIIQLLLERGDESLYQRLIARELKILETTAKYNIERLEKLGLIKIYGKNLKFIELTKKGRRIASKILDVSFKNLKFRCHDYLLTANIIRKPKNWCFPKPQFKAVSDEVRMTHWRQQKEGRWDENFFLISNSSISLRIKDDIITPDPVAGAYQGLDIFIKFAKDLELANPELKIGKPYIGSVVIISTQEYAMRLPNRREFNKPIKTKIFHIDWSKGYPEIDFTGSDALDNSIRFQYFLDLLLADKINPEMLKTKNLRKIYELHKIDIPTSNSS